MGFHAVFAPTKMRQNRHGNVIEKTNKNFYELNTLIDSKCHHINIGANVMYKFNQQARLVNDISVLIVKTKKEKMHPFRLLSKNNQG